MRRRPRDFPADSGMGRRMSFARRWKAQALGLVFVIAFLAVAVSVASTARAAPRPIEPAAAMTLTVVLDKSSYLSGDTASATAIVYRTPAPANYTYTWRVRDFFFRLLNQTANGPATFLYPIALSYTGTLRFDVTVNDGQGLVVGSPVQSAAVAPAYMALSLDRGDYNPGDTISAYYSVASHVITSPTYTYEVDDSGATAIQSVPMAAGGVGFWSTDVGGAPVYAIVLGLLFLLVLVGVVGLWRRTGGGFRFLHRGTPPPPPEGATHAPAATPMSVNCRRCGKLIDLTTSRRPIEVMCPSCGETQVVT